MTKIEEVARAIEPDAFMATGPAVYVESRRAAAIVKAIVAIRAMREPNDAMWGAADDSDDRGKCAAQHWFAMIDAALAEQP